jgi:NhaP-type Na+/H+ or K+/H+ antiporter
VTTAQILIGFGTAARFRPADGTAAAHPDLGRLFETLVQLIIGVLFISISATVTPQSIRHLIVPALVLVAALVIVARPVAAFAATLKTDLPKGERAFIGWMAPRGIVAAATASTSGAGLAAKGIGGAVKILPATFLVIVATVTRYGLTAAPVVPVPAAQATS